MTGGLAAELERVRGALATAVARADDVGAAVDGALAALPAAVAAPARVEAAALRQAARDVGAGFTTLVTVPGDPEALRAVGAAWVERVCGPVSRLAGAATLDAVRADDHWAGAAADAYRAVLPAQQAALAAVAAVGQEVDAVLVDVASAIMRFWVALGAACLVLVVALTTALAAAATVAGAPLAAGTALAAVAALVAAGDAALAGLTELTTVTATRAAALERRLADDAAFPLGDWPRSTAVGGEWRIR